VLLMVELVLLALLLLLFVAPLAAAVKRTMGLAT